MPPDEPTDEERLEQEAQDYDTPFHPADPNPPDTAGDESRTERAAEPGSTYPQGDSNVQKEELYDAGEGAAMGVPEVPNVGNAVTDYTPNQSDSPDDSDNSKQAA
ncbi:MAG TPA: hypothetical protein VHD60_00045 [Candidatus Saccharimonadales bacterium]|nr:hypothetical protein [Candidatus Saccharimonadales bacterium]